MIGVMNGGGTGDDLNGGEPYASNSGSRRPTSRCRTTSARATSFRSTRRSSSTTARTSSRALQERRHRHRAGQGARQADCFLGITNTYSRDGNASNTYLDANGGIPNNFTNSSVNEFDELRQH